MTRHRVAFLSVGVAVAASSLALAGCGSSSGSSAADSSTTVATTAPSTTAPATVDTETEKNQTTPAPATAAKVAVVMGKPSEFTLARSRPRCGRQGDLRVQNVGKVVHEMVVVPSPNGAAGSSSPTGRPARPAPRARSPIWGRARAVSLTVTLPAGKYVLLCNLPGHYASGMYATSR